MHCQWQQLSSTTTKKYMVVVLGKIRQLSIILPEYVWITYEGLKFTPHVTTIKDLHFLFSKMTHLEIYLYTYMYTQTIIKQLLTTSCITERTQWSKPLLVANSTYESQRAAIVYTAVTTQTSLDTQLSVHRLKHLVTDIYNVTDGQLKMPASVCIWMIVTCLSCDHDEQNQEVKQNKVCQEKELSPRCSTEESC